MWRDVTDTVEARIYGPHMEDLARTWCQVHADADTLGGRTNLVRSAVLSCREHRRGHEVDVVAIQDLPQRPRRVVAIGEVKPNRTVVGSEHLARLDHLRALLPPLQVPEPPKLLLFARGGFAARLQRVAESRPDVELIDMERLYTGA